MMNFLLVEWKNDDEFFISVEKKLNAIFHVCVGDKAGEA